MTEIGKGIGWASYGSDCEEQEVDGPEEKLRPKNGPTPTVTKSGLTLEEGTKLLETYTSAHGAFLMLRGDGTYDYCERPSQPCIGWMRTYGKGNLRESYWPSDLVSAHNLFPDGLPVLLNKTLSIPAAMKELVEETFLSYTNSPWRKAIFNDDGVNVEPKFVLFVDKKNELRMIWHDLDIEATQLVSLLRSMRSVSYSFKAPYDKYVKEHGPKIATILALKAAQAFGNAGTNWKAIWDGEPKAWTKAKFKDRGAYRRAVVEFPFGKGAEGPQPKTITDDGLIEFFKGL